jgi:hypothetical protein
LARSRSATGDAAAGCPSPTNVHAIESLKIGVLQHHCLGHRLGPVEDYLKPKVFSVEPSTRVMGLSEKMSLHTIPSVFRISGTHLPSGMGAPAIVR